MNQPTWFDNYFGWLERLLKKTCSFKVGVLLLSVFSVLLVLAVPLSIQAYQRWKEQKLIDIAKSMSGDLSYWRAIVDFEPWVQARGLPFAICTFGLITGWAAMIIARSQKTSVKIPKTAVMMSAVLMLCLVAAAFPTVRADPLTCEINVVVAMDEEFRSIMMLAPPKNVLEQ